MSVRVPWRRTSGFQGGEGLPLIPPISPHNPPQLLGPSCSQEDEGLHCSCSSQARPAPSLRWRLGEGLLEGNFSNASFKVTSAPLSPPDQQLPEPPKGSAPASASAAGSEHPWGPEGGSVLLLPTGQESVGGRGLEGQEL